MLIRSVSQPNIDWTGFHIERPHSFLRYSVWLAAWTAILACDFDLSRLQTTWVARHTGLLLIVRVGQLSLGIRQIHFALTQFLFGYFAPCYFLRECLVDVAKFVGHCV